MDQKLFLARVAEQAARNEDMVQFIEEAIEYKTADDFTMDERNLLSLGFKNLIASQRMAIRIIYAIESNDKYKKYHDNLTAYKK